MPARRTKNGTPGLTVKLTEWTEEAGQLLRWQNKMLLPVVRSFIRKLGTSR